MQPAAGITQSVEFVVHQFTQRLPQRTSITKALLINGINELKSCLELFLWCIPQIELQKNLLKASKYDSLFSVGTLKVWVQEGMPFRDAYQKMKTVIASGEFKPKKNIPHTHLGSRGNLALTALRKKMAAALQ